MKLDIQSPFEIDYKAAYLVTNKEPRRVVVLVKKDGSKTSMSYARYLMCCHLNRLLDKKEHVDHIDGDKLNDVIENLQILSQRENNIKKVIQNKLTRRMVKLLCPSCKQEFTRPLNSTHLQKGGGFSTCSRTCKNNILRAGLTKEQQLDLGRKQVIEQFRE